MLRVAPQRADAQFVGRCILFGAIISFSLVAYGVFLNPIVSRLSIAAATTALLAYAAIGRFLVSVLFRRFPGGVTVAKWAGVIAASVFAVEVCLEYVILPKNNAPWGVAEFGLVFAIYTSAGFLLALARRSISEAILGSTLSAMVSSVIWCVFVLATFYLFNGTERQKEVFQAEGDFDDFRNSGMSNFSAFITEDFFGATFYHLILGPLVASVLGLLGGVIGKAIASFLKRRPAV